MAAVILIGSLCARLAGRNWRDTAQWGMGPAIGGLVGAGLVFSSLPGHVDQMNGAANVLPFVSLAVLLGYTALRSGSIIPGFLVHLTIDLAALAYFAGAMPNTLRVVVDVGALIGLELGLMLAGRRLGLRRRMPRVIDLREPSSVAPAAS
jgi:membrane protease YdiL (CAAX protease family)